jgi:hypothetical protein
VEALAATATAWVRALELGGGEERALRRLVLARRELMMVLPQLTDADVLDPVLRGLLRLADLGHLEIRWLADVVAPNSCPTAALIHAQVAWIEQRDEDARRWVAAAVEGPSPTREVGSLLQAVLDGGGAARIQALGDRLLEEPPIAALGAVGLVIDAAMSYDLASLSDRLAMTFSEIAEASGARWRASQLCVHAFRARALASIIRVGDESAVIRAIDTLQTMGDHRTATLGLQWLSRYLVASARVEEGLNLLDRVQTYLDMHGSPPIRQIVVLDRARALALMGRVDEARREHERLELGRVGPLRLPDPVRALDAALLDLVCGEPRVALGRLTAMRDAGLSPLYAQLVVDLRAVATVWTGDARVETATESPWVGRIIDAWTDRERLAEVLGEVEKAAEHAEIGLEGVVVRAVCRAVRRSRSVSTLT